MNATTVQTFPSVAPEGDIALRRPRPEDVSNLVDLFNDPKVLSWADTPSPFTPALARALVARWEQGWAGGTSLSFVVEDSGRFAATLTLEITHPGRADLSFAVLSPFCGRRVVESALRMLRAWIFVDLDLDVLVWTGQVGDWTARKTLWAVGFQIGPPVRQYLSARAPARQLDGYQPRTGRLADAWIATLTPYDAMRPLHPWITVPRLAAPDFVLRAHHDGDLPRIVEACNDPVTRHWLSALPRPGYTTADAHEYLDRIATEHAGGMAYHWAIADPTSDALVGDICLTSRAPLDVGAESADLSYWVHPAARGRSLASRAARMVTDFALLPAGMEGLGLAHVRLSVAEGNLASVRSALRAGFTPCGRQGRRSTSPTGERADRLLFERLPPAPGAPVPTVSG